MLTWCPLILLVLRGPWELDSLERGHTPGLATSGVDSVCEVCLVGELAVILILIVTLAPYLRNCLPCSGLSRCRQNGIASKPGGSTSGSPDRIPHIAGMISALCDVTADGGDVAVLDENNVAVDGDGGWVVLSVLWQCNQRIDNYY